MPLETRPLEEALARALGEPVALALAVAPLAEEGLTAGERERLARLSGEGRREDWLRGRAALKRLLARLGEDDDTSACAFPHPRLSLTHAGGWAVAAAVASAPGGTGVDLERGRLPREGSERFFLAEEERAWLDAAPAAARAGARLRLWTVKEALFKANLSNEGTRLGQYRVEDCAAPAGRAGLAGQAGAYRYASVAVGQGFLTLALRVLPC